MTDAGRRDGFESPFQEAERPGGGLMAAEFAVGAVHKQRSLIPPLAPPFKGGGLLPEDQTDGLLSADVFYVAGGVESVIRTLAATWGDKLGGSYLFTRERSKNRQQRAGRYLHADRH